MATEIDLFEMLELSPGPPEPDQAALAAQLAKRKQEWGRNLSQGGQKAKREAQKKLELLPQLNEIIGDPGRRRQAAAIARARLEAASQEARRELDETIGLLKRSSLYCDRGQLEALVQRFPSFGRPEIERSLRAAGVSLERKRRAPAAEPIDAALAQAIEVQLQHLAKKNLYDFLGLPPQSSARALQDEAKEIYRENQRLGRGDSASSAANRLSGLCADRVFVDEAARQRYDAYLAIAAMASLKPDLDFAGLDKSLSPSAMDHFLEVARRRGVATEAALSYIERYAEERGWRIQSAAEPAAQALQLCGFCAALAPPAAERCPTCGRGLTVECPRCRRPNPTSAALCFHCSCSVGDAAVVQALLAEARRLLVERQFAEALHRAERGLLYWPDWEKLAEIRQQALAGKRRREEQLAELDQLLADGRLQAADQLLQKLQRDGVAGLDATGQRIEDGLVKARQLFDRGLRARAAGDRAGAEASFEQALACCSDLTPLLALLAENPPVPPAALRVAPLDQGFRLEWPAAEGASRYRVLRKEGGPPGHDADGQRLAEVAATELNDLQVPVGRPFHYAVFSLRRGVPSRGAAASGPHLRRSESLKNLACQKTGQAILLTWDWPDGIAAARVCLDHEQYPENAASPGASFDLSAADYRRDGAFVLRQPVRKKHYFSVFARAPDGSFSAAARIFAGLGQETAIRYRLALQRSFLRKKVTGARLELLCDDGDLRLPELVVIGKPGVVPLSPRDGRMLLQVPQTQLEQGLASIGIPPEEWNSGCYIKVFFPDSAAGEGLRLLPAAKHELFLG